MNARVGHFWIWGGVALLIAASPAAAQTFLITARGTVGSICSIAVSSPFGAANFGSAGSISANATVNCNTGFIIRATSANGAVRTSTAAPSGGAFVNQLAYTARVSVPVDSGAVVSSAACSAATLTAGQGGCDLSPAGLGLRSTSLATNKTATITAAWTQPPATARLVAGSYSDTLTISIASAP